MTGSAFKRWTLRAEPEAMKGEGVRGMGSGCRVLLGTSLAGDPADDGKRFDAVDVLLVDGVFF